MTQGAACSEGKDKNEFGSMNFLLIATGYHSNSLLLVSFLDYQRETYTYLCCTVLVMVCTQG